MNMTSKAILWIALILIAAGVLLLAFGPQGALFDSSLVGAVEDGFTGGAGYTVCQTGRESFSAGEVKRIEIGWSAGTVKLETNGGQTIALGELSKKTLQDGEKLRWKLEKGTLSIRYCANGQTKVPEKELSLILPADWNAEEIELAATSADVTLSGLRAKGRIALVTTSGEQQLSDCACGELSLASTSGGIGAENCRCETLDAGTTSGGVGLKRCVGKTIRVGATSGSLSVVACEAERIEAASVSGAIRCEDVPPRCELDLGSTSGDVRVSLRDANNAQEIDIETTSGDVYLDVPGSMALDFDTVSGSRRGTLSEGDDDCPRVEVDTTSGDLILGKFN